MKKSIYFLARIFFMLFSRKPIVTAQMKRILVVKLCCIGDILFTTPVLRALHEHYPRARITYLTCSWCQELAAADPRVQDVILFDAYDKVRGIEKMRRAWRIVREIRKQRFDLALVLHRTPLAGMLVAMAGVPVRIGFDWEGGGFAYTHRIPFRADAHEIDRHVDCLKPLAIHPSHKEPEMKPLPAASKQAETFLKQHGYSGQKNPLIAVFPAGGVNPGTVMISKRWLLEGYREVCSQLIKRYQAHILLVGNQDDILVGDQLIAGQAWADGVIRSEGRTTLMVLAALLRQCVLFIGGDSGPLHIADAVGIPTVSIFGPTDPRLLAPRGARHRVIHAKLPCSPCYNPVTVRQRDVTVCQEKNMACMHQITSGEVLAAVEELLPLKGNNRL
jgi:lipopolysaccharide heptosyltransferase II